MRSRIREPDHRSLYERLCQLLHLVQIDIVVVGKERAAQLSRGDGHALDRSLVSLSQLEADVECCTDDSQVGAVEQVV